MSDIANKKYKIFSSYNNGQYYCFQSAEIKESGLTLVITITILSRVCRPTQVPNQSGVKNQEMVYSDSEWFMVRFDPLTIGQISYFGFGLTTFIIEN